MDKFRQLRHSIEEWSREFARMRIKNADYAELELRILAIQRKMVGCSAESINFVISMARVSACSGFTCEDVRIISSELPKLMDMASPIQGYELNHVLLDERPEATRLDLRPFHQRVNDKFNRRNKRW